MAKRIIVTEGDEILRKKSRIITEFNDKLHQLLDDMAETMYEDDGVGLSAVQVGILRRAVVVDTGDKLYEMVNPEIIEQSGSQTGLEGCLSFPNQYGEVTRPMNVTVKAQDRNGEEYTVTTEGLLARAFCHEIDHLDGILFIDLAKDLQTEEVHLKRRKRR